MEQLKDVFVKAFMAYTEMLELHIDSKTVDEPFHEKTGDAYDLLFAIAHNLAERYIDLGGKLRADHGDCKTQGARAIEILEGLKKELESIRDITPGTKAMIDNHLDNLEFVEGNLKGFSNKVRDKTGIELGEEVESKVKVKATTDETISDEAGEIISM